MALQKIESALRSIDKAMAPEKPKTSTLERDFRRILRDPEIQAKARAFSRACTPTWEELNRPFTI